MFLVFEAIVLDYRTLGKEKNVEDGRGLMPALLLSQGFFSVTLMTAVFCTDYA